MSCTRAPRGIRVQGLLHYTELTLIIVVTVVVSVVVELFTISANYLYNFVYIFLSTLLTLGQLLRLKKVRHCEA